MLYQTINPELIKNKEGRKRRAPRRKVVTPEMLEEVQKLAGLGMTESQIGYYYGMSEPSWGQRKKDYPELVEAIKIGKSKTLKKVTGKLMEAIEKGSLAAIIFYLKTQFRWTETFTNGVNSDGAAPPALSLTINDPKEAAKIYQQIMTGS